MKTTLQEYSDCTDAYIFTILCHLRIRDTHEPLNDLRRALRMAWIDSPDTPAGRSALTRAIRKAQEQDLIKADCGSGGGFHITGKGKLKMQEELKRENWLHCPFLQEAYKNRLRRMQTSQDVAVHSPAFRSYMWNGGRECRRW